MHREVLTITQGEPVDQLIEILVREHIHGLPVLDDDGKLVGVVTQQDVFFSSVTLSRDQAAVDPSPGAHDERKPLRVQDIMTSPAVFAAEDTDILSLCQIMTRLRIHRVPILRDGKVSGIVSSLDICRALAKGHLEP